MPWLKVDDGFYHSRKVMLIPRSQRGPTLGLWLMAGCWCAEELTDGHVPTSMVEEFGYDLDAAVRLVAAGLWEVAEDGWVFHDWADYQPTRESVLADREAARLRKQQQRTRESSGRFGTAPTPKSPKRPKRVTPDSEDVTPMSHRDTPVSHTVPDPTRTRTQSPTDSVAADGGAALSETPQSAQNLVAEWIDHEAEKPPSRVIGQVARELGVMLGEGIPYASVRRGLQVWAERRLHASVLPSVVHEMAAPAKRGQQHPEGGTISRRQQETDDQFQRAMERARARDEAKEAG